MKIREIRTWVLRHELPEAEVFGSSKGWHTVRQALVVEILTEDGLTGFGEAYGPPAVNRTLVDEVYAPRLVGKNALEHAVLWEDLYTTFRDYGRKGWPVAAISAIDIALWDLKGKALRQPVSRLLGGPFRTQVRAYATGLYRHRVADNATALAREAEAYAAEGFHAMKMKVRLGLGPHGLPSRRGARRRPLRDPPSHRGAAAEPTCPGCDRPLVRARPYAEPAAGPARPQPAQARGRHRGRPDGTRAGPRDRPRRARALPRVSARALTPRLDALKPYGVAVVTVGLALPVAQALWPSVRPTVSPVFLAAVMVAAWFGGLRGGLLATVLASLLMDYFFFEPVRSLFSFSHREDVLRLGVFVLVAVLISLLNAARRRAEAVLDESRRFLQSTLDSLTTRIAIIDGRGVIVAVNEAWHNFDKPPGVGSDYLSTYGRASGDAAEATRAAAAGIRNVLERRRDTFSAEVPEGGGWFAVRATRFESGREVRVVLAHEDVTERRRAEEAKRAAEALRSVARLALAAAHEINNPLVTIRGNLDLLGRHVGEELARTRLQPVFDAVERIRAVVARLGNITELRVSDRWPTLPEMLDLQASSSPEEEGSDGPSRAGPSA